MAKRAELYEIIANSMGDAPAADAAEVVYELPTVSPRSRSREIVLSLDAAFVIFVLFLILLGTAYTLGVNSGEQKERESFNAPRVPAAEAELGELKIDRSAPLAATVLIPPQQFTMRLTEADDLDDLRVLRAAWLDNAVIRDGNLEVFIFDDGKKYILTVGAFSSPEERNLGRVREFIAGQPAYRDAVLAKIGDLGKAML
ncbi:hypothetical protein FACS1894139_08620 [Planctomycetales bacterium]|nr:hypothetical protein FACS1894139_08620 [Planctomycetales bacterium]GHV22430.1 hypothetical protein AGMMS49959_13220 [Planctomycetales bacterium]